MLTDEQRSGSRGGPAVKEGHIRYRGVHMMYGQWRWLMRVHGRGGAGSPATC